MDSPSTNPDVFPAPQTSMATSSSWWDYLTWAKSSADPQHVEHKDTATTDACDSVDPQPTTSSSPLPSISNPETSSHTGTVDPTAPAVTIFPEAKPGLTQSDGKAPDMAGPNTATGAGTAKEAAALPATTPSTDPEAHVRQQEAESTAPPRPWYDPWAWYASPPSSQDAIQGGSDQVVVDDHMGTRTAAERNGKGDENLNGLVNGGPSLLLGNGEVNGDAAVDAAGVRPRPRGESEENPDGRTSKDGEREEANPVEASIITHRTGWASFFMSRSLIVKTITSGGEAKRDENGMEVMDIDDEEGEKDGQSGDVTSRGRDDTAPKVGPRAIPSKNKDLGPIQATPASSPGSAASIKAANGVAVKIAAPQEAVKKETTGADKQLPNQKKSVTSRVAKSESPGPSTKSGTRTPRPRTPPPPNLVLPTWTDTFYTAPRSVVPPPMTKFAKTMKFVSGVLFAQDQEGATGGTVRGKGKGKENDYLHFGQKLPRAWDVTKDNLDPDVLRGCRRVVVIGIHGWFPGEFYSCMKARVWIDFMENRCYNEDCHRGGEP